jgi:iron complex outermembrane receptor protein
MKALRTQQRFEIPLNILAAVFFAATAIAQTNTASVSATNLIEELKKLSVEELMQQQVTSVERRESTVGQSAAAIYVITQEEIRRSGSTTIPELFRRVPGMNVARINGNVWAVSVRGFNDRFANKLLVQMDGRTLYNPIFAGVYWDGVDYPLADIERIEIIRGPGASVWGANAVNGVVNIITKSSNDTKGGLLVGGAGNEETGFGTLRYGGNLTSNLTYRVFANGFDRDGQFSMERPPNDQWWGANTGVRLDWKPDDRNNAMLEGGYLHSVAGQSNLRPQAAPPFAFVNLENEVADAGHVLGRWIHQINNTDSWTAQLYWDHVERHSDNRISNYRWDTFDADFQHEFSPWDRHRIVYGAGYRYLDFFGGQSERDAGLSQEFTHPRHHLQLASAFVQDDVTLIEEKFHLIAGSKFEHNDFTGFEVQPTGRLLWTPTKRQSAWFSVSRAVRTPSLGETDLRITGPPIAPAVLPQVQPNPNFRSEELIAYELGYRAQVTHAFSVDAALFYNVYDRLAVAAPGAPTAPPPPIFQPLVVVNDASGESEGAEIAATWQAMEGLRLYAAYSLIKTHLRTKMPAPLPPETAAQEPQQQVYAQFSLDLPQNIEFDLIGRWVDRLTGFSPVISDYFALDARLAWHPRKNLEIAIVGQNLLDNRHPEFGTHLIISTTRTEIERSIYAKLTLRF